MIERITHYTTIEGGEWYDWPGGISNGVPIKEMLTQMQKEAKYSKVFTKSTVYQTIYLHSFKTSFDRAWDVVNGWRQ